MSNYTTAEQIISVSDRKNILFAINVTRILEAWRKPMQEVFK